MGPLSYMRSVVDWNVVMQRTHQYCWWYQLVSSTITIVTTAKYKWEHSMESEINVHRVPLFVFCKLHHQWNDESWCLLNPSVVSRPSTCRCMCWSIMSSLSACPCCRLWRPSLSGSLAEPTCIPFEEGHLAVPPHPTCMSASVMSLLGTSLSDGHSRQHHQNLGEVWIQQYRLYIVSVTARMV
jgi:hypothetical protein